MNVWASKALIGTVNQEESTWFKGYNERYYFDRGYLFGNMYGWKAKYLLMLLEFKEKHTKSQLSFHQRLKIEKKAIKEYLGKK